MRRWLSLFITLALFASTGVGCARSKSPMDLWVASFGGVDHGAAEARADSVAAPLFALCSGKPLSISVLKTTAATAYSWPDGHLFVTQGMVDRLSDQELAASVAHELGHLLNDGRVDSLFGLNGNNSPLNIEAHADATGLRVLQAAGIPQSAMASMLSKVVRAGASPLCQQALARRIELLHDAE